MEELVKRNGDTIDRGILNHLIKDNIGYDIRTIKKYRKWLLELGVITFRMWNCYNFYQEEARRWCIDNKNGLKSEN